MNHSRFLPIILLAALAGCKHAEPAVSGWLSQVPPETRALADPLPPTGANIAEGRSTYGLYCTSCHADDAGGRRGRPSLRTAHVRGETDGEIFWILQNGSKGHGMPAWRSLGDPALWQLVQYIRALPPAARQ